MARLKETLDFKTEVALTELNSLTHSGASREQSAVVHLLLVEEMAELTQEIVKHFVRGKSREKEIAFELADVIMLLDQVVELHDENLVAEALSDKIARLKRRRAGGMINGTPDPEPPHEDPPEPMCA